MPNCCDTCSAFGEFVSKDTHGSYTDYNFECECGTKWTWITEGIFMRRKQIEYPRDKHMAFEWLGDFL